MVSRVCSVAIVGMEAVPVEVEVNLVPGLPDFQIVGLPSQAVREARKRVEAAVTNSNEGWPSMKITANLAPGDLRKESSLFDLPLAVGVLAAQANMKQERIKNYMVLGELALDGRLRPVRGALAAALAARAAGKEGLLLPKQNEAEASLVPGIEVVGAETLFGAISFLTGDLNPVNDHPEPESLLAAAMDEGPDFSEVRGQALARRALEISAVGGHNVLMVGPPGCGKTMLARRLPGVLPPLSVDEALETTHVWSVAGLLGANQPMVVYRPFRSPHHHASAAAVIGGGHGIPRPGEVSLATHGVLFMDELPLFSPRVLEALRQPLEDGRVTVARQGACATFPSKFCLVGAANPCLCGRLGDPRRVCTCSPGRLDSYRSRLSGPLLDRIDLHVEVALMTPDELSDMQPSESSASVRRRVIAARRFGCGRRAAEAKKSTVLMSLNPGVRRFFTTSLTHERFSARGTMRALAVARSIADLAASVQVEEEHVAEALQFRRSVWDH